MSLLVLLSTIVVACQTDLEPARNQLRIARDTKPTGNDKHPFSARAIMRYGCDRLSWIMLSRQRVRREERTGGANGRQTVLPRNLSFRCLETLSL